MTGTKSGWVAVGDIEIASVWDGTLKTDLKTIQQLDPDEARRLVEAGARATGSDPLNLPVRAFLIRAGGLQLLCDTGSGTTKGPTMGLLPASLARLGVQPQDIDAVLMTHLHMDHIGGLVDEAGKPAFPHAEVVLHEAEARHFLDTPAEALDPRSQRNLDFQRPAIAAYGKRVRRVKDGEGWPGIAARLAPGHTPGHTAWEISSRGQTAFVIGDVVHMGAVQLPLPLTPMIYDVDPKLAGRTRVALLNDAVKRRALVAGAHLPGNGIGHIVKAGEGYAFEASSTTMS